MDDTMIKMANNIWFFWLDEYDYYWNMSNNWKSMVQKRHWQMSLWSGYVEIWSHWLGNYDD